MNLRRPTLYFFLGIAWSAAAVAERQPGWEYGADIIFQASQDIGFNGGSQASLDDDFGIALVITHRFSKRLELMFGLDWNRIDYDVDIASATPGRLPFSAHGDLEAFTPRVGINFNFLEGDLTPYITGSVGYSFIDTNIPDGPPQTGCWWDPWYGNICTTWQETRSIDEFSYGVGAGLRWDLSTWTLRFGYEKHWLDLGKATSTPDFDQLRLGVMVRY